MKRVSLTASTVPYARMLLFVVRHAKAFERDSNEWPDDSLRPLTKGGVRKFEQLAERLAQIHAPPEFVLASGYERAWRTVRILSKVAGWPEPIRCMSLECDQGEDMEAVRTLLAARTERSAAIVGHEPMLSDFVAELLGCTDSGVLMKKGAVAILDIANPSRLAEEHSIGGASATLLALLDPNWLDPSRKER